MQLWKRFVSGEHMLRKKGEVCAKGVTQEKYEKLGSKCPQSHSLHTRGAA